MFHKAKIEEKLLVSWIELNKQDPQLFPEGSVLIRHTIPAIQQANIHLDNLILENGELSRPFNLDELKWIRNERAICRADFLYWATHYAYIKDWTGDYILFSPNLAQQIVISVMAEMESRDIAILLQVHKARQLGVTTLSELIMLWRTMFTPGANTLLASSRPEKTPEMVGKMSLAYERLPYWMKPEIGTNNSSKLGFDAQKSFFHLRHGAMMSDMGRGDTMTSFHLSEVSEFTNPKEAIDAALLRGAHDSPWLLGIMESTGKGKSGWWFDTWNYNAEFYPLGEARICPVFLPWYIATDLYPTQAWLRAHPIKKDWVPEERTLAHAAKATEYVQSGENQVVTNELGRRWEMPRKQMWYWELERRGYERKKELHLFYQEMCATPEEGFQSPNSGIFDADLIHNLRDNTPIPYGVYGIRCSQAEVPYQHQVRDIDIDPDRKPINITANWSPSQPKHDYILYPLLHRGAAPFSPLGKIIMYEPPRNGKFYGIGCDTGYGIGKDNSVLQGLRKGDMEESDAQVFEFASPQLSAFILWPIALALGTLYSTYVAGQRRQTKMVIEGAANGEWVYNELKKRGWSNFHNWIRYNRKRVLESQANVQLWNTNSWSRPMLLDLLMDAVNSGWLDINSPWFVDELGTLEFNEDKQKMLASAGFKDDRIMAMGMVLVSLHAQETKHNDHWRERILREKLDPETFAKYSPNAQETGPTPDGTDSYNYNIIRPGDFTYDMLRKGGASIWTPDN